MQTIILVLDPGNLENPDMDLCYCIPDRIEEVSNSVIQHHGYGFIDTEAGRPGPLMEIRLKTENAGEYWPLIHRLFREETFLGNDLSASAQIYISEQDTDDPAHRTLVFPIE